MLIIIIIFIIVVDKPVFFKDLKLDKESSSM